MKKLILLFVVALIISCTKTETKADRTCNCKTDLPNAQVNSTIYRSVTLTQAQNLCVSTTQNYYSVSTYTQKVYYYPGSVSYSIGTFSTSINTTINNNCELK
jgi:hypothetical protein